MGIRFVGSSAGSLTALTGGIDTQAREGDLVIAVAGLSMTTDQNITCNTAGFTELADLYANDTEDAQLAAYWKIMGSTPDTSVSISFGTAGVGDGRTFVVHVYRGVDPTTPFDVTSTTATGIDAAAPNPAAITPVTAGAWVVVGGVGTWTGTPSAPSGYTGLKFETAAATRPITVSIAYRAYNPAGLAADPGAFGGYANTTSDSWAAITMALRPAPELIRFVGRADAEAASGVALSSSLTALTAGVDTTARAGDLVVVIGSTLNTTTDADFTNFMSTSGYTKLDEWYVNGTSDTNAAIFYKFMGSTPDTTVASTAFSANKSWRVLVFRGVDLTNPFDVTRTVVTETASMNADPPDITPVTDGCMMIALNVSVATSTQRGTITYPAFSTVDKLLGLNSATYSTVLTAMEWQATAGLWAPSVWTNSGNSASYTSIAICLALRPAARSGTIKLVGYLQGDNSGAAGNVTVPFATMGTTLAQGDIVFLALNNAVGGTTDSNYSVTGYTKADSLFGSNATSANLEVFYKVMGSTPDTNITFPRANPEGSATYQIVVVRGVNTSNILDVTSTTATGTTGGVANPPSITPTTTGAVVLCFSVGTSGGSVSSFSSGPEFDWQIGFNDTDSNDTVFSHVGWKYWSSGAFDPAALSGPVGDGTSAWASLSIALRPVGGSASGQIKVWITSSWVAKPVKVWNGSAWVTKPLKRWNGSAWVATTY